MKTYRITLKLDSGILTPIQADTLFGRICWIKVLREEEEGLRKFLEEFKNNRPPFLISNGFPAGFLPKPLSLDFAGAKEDDLKELKRADLIPVEQFNRVVKGEQIKIEWKETTKQYTRTHNRVDRNTGSTPSDAGLYTYPEEFTEEVHLYLKAETDEWQKQVVDMFKEMSQFGYGRRKSIGKGRFSVEDVVEFPFPKVEDPNGFVTLSHFCPAANDPTYGLYKTLVKYGKLGEEFTFSGNPFKRPLVMIQAGSVFHTEGEPNQFYGRLIDDGIAPAKEEVVHYAYAFAVPILLKGAQLFQGSYEA